MDSMVKAVELEGLKNDIPQFYPGSTVRVHVRVTEGDRQRIQVFEGVVIRRAHGGLRETFTVRKISYGIGVERAFALHSPVIDKIEVVKHSKVRRGKLYYLRSRRGKAARLKEVFGSSGAVRSTLKEPPPEDEAETREMADEPIPTPEAESQDQEAQADKATD